MVTRRPAEPQRIRITTAVAMTAVSALIAVLGSWYAQKADVAAAMVTIARHEAQIAKLEAATSQGDKLIAVVAGKLDAVSERLKEVNDHLGRIEDRQVNVIVPAVTGNRNNR